MPGPLVMFWLRSLSSMLSPRDQSPAVLKNAWPENLLPPDFGRMFMVGPPVSFSPRPPETSIAISSALFVSYVSDETPPPLKAAATVMPLIAIRPSLVRPPCALKNVIVGVAARPLLSTVTPGIAFRIEPRSEEHTSELQSRGHLVCR